MHTGYFPTKQFEGYIKLGAVLVAEQVGRGQGAEGARGLGEEAPAATLSSSPSTPRPLDPSAPTPIGYVISRDRYLKRDELGVVFQLCVAPEVQRGFVGASLIRAVFERSAYGCRLYCCWCAQDIEANYFWESLGFVPVAFRAGSTGKRRVHIFWQKRICAGDDVTPYWYPFQTNAGAIRQDRLVFPIPPGMHWRDVRPPEIPVEEAPKALTSEAPKPRKTKPADPKAGKVAIFVGGKVRYVTPQAKPGVVEPVKPAKKPRPEKAPPPKFDKKYLVAARELRDRWLEQVNATPMLPGSKYDVTRPPELIAGAAAVEIAHVKILPAA